MQQLLGTIEAGQEADGAGVRTTDGLVMHRSDGVPNGTLPVKLVIDASSDRRRAAYVALVVEHGQKPRVIYGIGSCISTASVESWGIKRALRRVNARYNGRRPIIIYTDNLSFVETHGSVHVQYRWLHRGDRLMKHLHEAANALRRSL